MLNAWAECYTLHSQKQSAHWAVDVTAQVVPCWLGSWLNHNYWLVIGPWIQLAFKSSERKITWVSYTKTVDSGISKPVNRKPPGSAAFEHLSLPCIYPAHSYDYRQKPDWDDYIQWGELSLLRVQFNVALHIPRGNFGTLIWWGKTLVFM